MSKLANLRKGIREHKIIDLFNTGEKVAIVSLKTNEIIDARQQVLAMSKEDVTDINTVDLMLNTYTLYKALRKPDNLEELYLESYKDLSENTTVKEIYELLEIYLEVQNGKDPDLENMTEEEFEELKKKLEKMELKELDGELQNILRYCHQVLTLQDLQKDS